mmetsp:Transcript_57870/g.188118  ORF Transcript_57870/g.188118 Transcript_57870/m.188118 type:complete len:713 (+) Transcript_57870:3-2141(+)
MLLQLEHRLSPPPSAVPTTSAPSWGRREVAEGATAATAMMEATVLLLPLLSSLRHAAGLRKKKVKTVKVEKGRAQGGNRRPTQSKMGDIASLPSSSSLGAAQNPPGGKKVALVDVRSFKSLALKSHHNRHVKADINGEIKASSMNVGEQEKFDLVHNEDASISLRSCHGKYVSVDKMGDLCASATSIGDAEKFQLVCNDDGTISFKSIRGFVSAQNKCGLIANRAMIGAWERFQAKDRSRQTKQNAAEDASAGADGNEAAAAALPIFDACCHLQAVLCAEEQYSITHSDKTAITFGKRAGARRDQGLEWSFRYFREQQSYSSVFRGCVSAWDATVVRLEADSGSASCRDRAGSGSGDPEELDGVTSVGEDNAWASILAQGEEDRAPDFGPMVHAAFGIPAASAADANEQCFERLSALCRLPLCVAVGPVSLSFPDIAAGIIEAKEHHRDLSAAEVALTFGALPGSAYDAKCDPACSAWLAAGGSTVEDWTMKKGDRRLSEFKGACADYARRRLEAQVSVAEFQIALAKELGLPLIVQLPPQTDAERKMAEILVDKLGGEGCEHPVLLSAFYGRPKCVGALLKHFPNLMVGFSGLLTHSKLKDSVGEIAFDVPMDRFVLESLGPRFPPAGVGDGRGSFSHPALITHVAAELAAVKRVSQDEIFEAALRNVLQLFRLPRARAGSGASDVPEPSESSSDSALPAADMTGQPASSD